MHKGPWLPLQRQEMLNPAAGALACAGVYPVLSMLQQYFSSTWRPSAGQCACRRSVNSSAQLIVMQLGSRGKTTVIRHA